MSSRYLDPPRPRLFAHRGASGHFPENTLPAFAAALEAGIPYLEMDVWATADGTIVVHHDETLRRLCGVERRISEVTLRELKAMDAGFGFIAADGSHPHSGCGITVPTLAEVLTAFPQALCNIELKQESPAVEEQVIRTISLAGAAWRVLLAAEKDVVMRRLRPLCGMIPTSLSFGEAAAFFAWLAGGCRDEYRPPGVALQIPVRWGEKTLVTAESVAAAHATGLEVHVWTVNDPKEMRRLLAMGVDGLMSDYPELLSEVTERE